MPRIDAHVHFYTARDLARVTGGVPYTLPAPHPLSTYLDTLIDAGVRPTLLNNVHLSILSDSENVFASFNELAGLQERDPVRYGSVRLVGTILADPLYASAERLAHPQVQGVRIVLHDAIPEAFSDDAYAGAEWQQLFAGLRADQHVHVYAQEAAVNLKVLRQLPKRVPVLIDHLGTCHPERGVDDPAFAALLHEASERGNVYFKGPGYRTAIDAAAALPFAVRIVERVGAHRLLLEASDAPHVGDREGRAYADYFTPLAAFDFVARLARATAARTGTTADALLRGASAEIFPTSL
ncbi:amidohydrolase family protein [Mesorhizobium sp. M0909]|uniref:amidohydrolase family protein n=1 Tax=Mesorhizobium sp. M0909 TaxID=2957024 RepID=UPI00333B1172